ncbi:MAG: hypothetical protein BWY04_00534 [candidate division CPR1 bacterium ADurb.Bin160]|uniref:Uncharacterized protein n=1 Tax=candidate division CPR1 bacterium ADurb.Bin160 TaxID=1852826 RepID=A0A1V5ZPA2_9BACT|nr:MAG: hypothetical protein BWY04_00534 [candidate division CPR1 bacterium ADurb.Bin160]
MKIKRLHFGPYAQDVNEGIGFLTILARLVPFWNPIASLVVPTRTVMMMITSRGFYFKLFCSPLSFQYCGVCGAIFIISSRTEFNS